MFCSYFGTIVMMHGKMNVKKNAYSYFYFLIMLKYVEISVIENRRDL